MNKRLIAILVGIFSAITLPIILVALFVISTYNRIVVADQDAQRAWSQVENVYQRRYDLVPALVSTVKGMANFEKDTLTAVTQARASVGQIKVDPKSMKPADLEAFATSQQGLGTALSRLMVISEKYPELKATGGFRDLQSQLEGTENRISVERGVFNSKVNLYNSRIIGFPGNVVTGMFHFEQKPYFKIQTPQAAEAVKIDFSK